MSPRELFEIWAPAESVWSQWAKPALFASPVSPDQGLGPEGIDLEPLLKGVPPAGERAAVIVDLPGALSVRAGLELAEHGYRPVPMYNTTVEPRAIVNAADIRRALEDNASTLLSYKIEPDAPPAFMLDSKRLLEPTIIEPGVYDNRWIVFPQDFPSATFLLSRGIRRAVLVRTLEVGRMKDVDDVLARWGKGGIELTQTFTSPAGVLSPYTASRWWPVRLFFLFSLMLLGLKRNSAGGFGARIPEASSGSGWG
jgi:hypothetical protein